MRETWKWEGDTKYTDIKPLGEFYYKVDDVEDLIAGWKSSRFMPKLAARLFFEIINIRVERLQDISEVDAKQEGVMVRKGHKVKHLWSNEPAKQITHRQMFEGLWESINDKRGYGWESNPWVWVIEFKRIENE